METKSVSTHQEGKLVCILAGRGHPQSSRPVVVEVGEIVSESLQQPWGVLHYIVGGGIHGALVHRLRHEEEVVPNHQDVNNNEQDKRQSTNLSGRVTSLSTTVPLGGLEGFPFILHDDDGHYTQLQGDFFHWHPPKKFQVSASK